MGKVKVPTNQLIIEGEETFGQATAEPQRKSMCDGVIWVQGLEEQGTR